MSSLARQGPYWRTVSRSIAHTHIHSRRWWEEGKRRWAFSHNVGIFLLPKSSAKAPTENFTEIGVCLTCSRYTQVSGVFLGFSVLSPKITISVAVEKEESTKWWWLILWQINFHCIFEYFPLPCTQDLLSCRNFLLSSLQEHFVRQINLWAKPEREALRRGSWGHRLGSTRVLLP